jgi:hypothetical protein
MTAAPPVLPASSILLPPSSHCTFIPASKNSARVKKKFWFQFLILLKMRKSEIAENKIALSQSLWVGLHRRLNFQLLCKMLKRARVYGLCVLRFQVINQQSHMQEVWYKHYAIASLATFTFRP